MKNGVVTRKLAEMEETLRRLREHLPPSYEQFTKDWLAKSSLSGPCRL